MHIASDLLYTVKLLKKNAAFNLLCVLLIALGLMTSLCLFSLTWNLRLKTPDLPSVERLATLTLTPASFPSESPNTFPNQWFEFARDNLNSFSVFGASRIRTQFSINDGEQARVASTATISPSLLQATGVQPLLGRTLLPEDDRPEAEPVALLSYQLWQSYYAGDPGVVGQRSRIGGTPRTVVGIMPPGFGFPFNAELWLPLQLELTVAPPAGQQNLTLMGLLREGVSLEQANTEVMGVAQAFNREMDEVFSRPMLAFARPFNRIFSMPAAITVVLPVLTLAILLLVAFNMGNLLIYRANERAHELAVRSAVGGTRFRVIQVLLLESFLICALGCAFGLLLSAYALNHIDTAVRISFAGDNLPFWMNFGLDGAMITFSLAGTLLIWLLSGGLPAIRLFSRDLNSLLAAGSRGLSKKGSLRLTRAFVNIEVVVSCFLLIISLAFVVVTALDVRTDFGVESSGLFAGEVLIDRAGTTQMGEPWQYARELQSEQLSTTGITRATYSTGTPATGALQLPYNLEDRDLADVDGTYPRINIVGIADNYFDVLGVELVEGRNFNSGDNANSAPVVIIDQRLAAALWPAEARLGKRIQLDPEGGGPWLTVVGVSRTFYQEYNPVAGQPALLSLFRPFAQSRPNMFFSIIETALPSMQAYDHLRSTTARSSPDLGVHRIDTLYNKMLVTSRPFLMMRDIFIAITALVALLIGSVIYGLISRSYMSRADEIGLRRALGASNRQAVMPFLREALVTLLLGLGIGGIGGVLFSNVLGGVFPNIRLYLPAIAGVTMLFIALIVISASYIPARRAVAMEPGEALRYE